MNFATKPLTDLDKRELTGEGNRPYLFADSITIDQAAIELNVAGITIAGVLPEWEEFEIAHAILEDVYVERPADRDCVVDDNLIIIFDTPEERAKIYTVEELEYEVLSCLKALHILNGPQEPLVEPNDAPAGDWAAEAIEAAEKLLQGFARGGILSEVGGVPVSLSTGYRTLDKVGLLSHEEVAAAFDKHVTGVGA